MARRPNYGGEKRRKEIERQRKKEEKVEKKRLRKEASATESDETTESRGEMEEDESGVPLAP